MLSFFLEKLALTKEEVSFIDLSLTNEEKKSKVIYVETTLNNAFFLQKSLENLASVTKIDQYLIFKFETLRGRENRIKNYYPAVIARIFLLFEFIIHRMIPKLPFVGKVYRHLMKDKIKILSKAEGLGRIVFAGFTLIEVENFDGYCTALVTPKKETYRRQKPSYGLIFRMNRIGKNGKIIGVYKFRTMHPYSEFIHDYILKINGYGEKGKPKNDFRVTNWGRFLRKYWLDEIPQLINVLKFEMKLVGLRPVSEVYFRELDEEQKKKRMFAKPGCIPPYIAFNMNSSKENVLKAEEMYLAMKEKYPYSTDLKLFFIALKNIIVSKKRGS